MPEQHNSVGHGDDAHDAAHHSFMTEEEQPKVSQLFLWGLVIAVVFFGTATICTTFFYRTADRENYDKILSVSSEELQKLRAQEEEKLTTYGWVDAKQGIVRIPIDWAMRNLVLESKK